MEIIVIKSILSVLLSVVVTIVIYFEKPLKRWLEIRQPAQVVFGAWLIARLLPFCVIYLALGFAPISDINGFFGQAFHAAKGEVVYRDFTCMYSPLFPYINGLAVWLWEDKRAVVATMLLIELLAVLASYSFFKSQDNKADLLFKILIYFVLPSSFVFCVLGGQEDEWMWLMAILSFLVWQKTDKIEAMGVVLLLGFLVSKAVFVLFLPTLLWLVPKPIRWIWPMAILGMITLAILYHFTKWEFILQPTNEANTLRSPNIPSVLSPLTFGVLHFGAKFWNWIGLLITVATGFVAAFWFKALSIKHSLSAVWVLLFGTMMVIQQSAYSSYIFIFLLPLSLVWIDYSNKKEVLILLIYNVVSAVHPSLWWRLQQPKYNAISEVFKAPIFVLDYALQLAVVLCTLYFLRLVWQKASMIKTG